MNRIVSSMSKMYMVMYMITHLLVDGICVGIVLLYFSDTFITGDAPAVLLVFYNLVAFGTQPLFGYLADRSKRSKEMGIVGMVFVTAGICLIGLPILAVPFLALGNAMFHVGGGIASLYYEKDKATMLGLFVAPGAFGVFAASFMSENNILIYVFGVLLLLCAIYFSITKNDIQGEYEKALPCVDSKMVVAVLALLSVVCARAIIGGAIYFEWKDTLLMKGLVVAMIAAGKAMGGILGDRFGLGKVGIIGLLIAAPMLAFGINIPALALIGLFSFSLTMPITLTLLGIIFRRYKGFAFGLTTLAIAVGYIINRYLGDYYINNVLFILAVILLSAGWLHQGFKSHKPKPVAGLVIEELEL